MGEHIHWYVTNRCNLNCNYCFKPDIDYEEKGLETLAQLLVENNVEKVTIGGGEPTLVKDLDKILGILKKGGIYVSFHTNGILLDDKRISQLSGLVDDIGLPIDSLDESVQKELRGEKFIPAFNRIFDIAESIRENNIGVGWHTVFTSINYKDIPEIYEKIKDFAYWRIYEFNLDLVLQKYYKKGSSMESLKERMKLAEKIKKISKLSSNGSPEKGYTDCLFAHFLLMEQEMPKHEHIQFVGLRDYKRPYAFLDNSGDVSFYAWFSGRERRVLGNIIKDGFSFVKERLKEVHEKAWAFDNESEDEFVNATMDRPVWARLDEGNYCDEEIEEIDEDYIEDVEHLAELHRERG